MASMHVLVEWIGDDKPDCWKIIRRDDFLKPEKLKEGEVLDAYWKHDEETSPAKVLKISDNKQYLQSVKENEYFKPWKNSVPPKRVSVRKQLPDDYVSSDEGKATMEANKKPKLKKAIEKKSRKTEPPMKRIKSSKSSGQNKSDDIAGPSTEETEKEFSKSSKDEAEKALAEALLKKTRQPTDVPSTDKNEDLSDESDKDIESEKDISEKAKLYGLVAPKKIRSCCEHCTQLRERVKELEADVSKLSKKIRSVSRTSSGLVEKIEGLHSESVVEANPEAELEKSCRQLTSNSTSLYVTVKVLLKRLFTNEEILSHSVSGKASNSKVVAKPRFDPMKIELIRKIASELHGSQIVNTSTVTHKIQAVQKAVKREFEGNSSKLGN